jgi:hypothetical protein
LEQNERRLPSDEVPGLDCDDPWAQVSAWLVVYYAASVVDWFPARKSRCAAVRNWWGSQIVNSWPS